MTEIIGNQEPAKRLENDGKKDHLYEGTQKFLRIIAETAWRNKFKVSGSENIPTAGSAILAVNHSMHADPEFLMVGINRPMHFIGERDKEFNPAIIKISYPLFGVVGVAKKISEEGGRRFVNQVDEVVKNKELLCWYPEKLGLEDRPDKEAVGEFASGVVHMAKKYNLPIIPVYISGTWNVRPNSTANLFQRMYLKPVEITIGKPIPAGEIQNAEQVRQAIIGLKNNLA